MKWKHLVILFFSLLVLSCNKAQLVFNKMLGNWKIQGKNEFERWTKNQDGTYNSVMYSLNTNDTVFSEIVKIYKTATHEWVFETFVSGQNENKTVKFTATFITSNKVVFENPNHDFPNVICYELQSDKALKAYIAGKGDTIGFSFVKP